MIQYERPDIEPKKERELELLRADRDKLAATLEYVAMMADINIEDGDEDE